MGGWFMDAENEIDTFVSALKENVHNGVFLASSNIDDAHIQSFQDEGKES